MSVSLTALLIEVASETKPITAGKFGIGRDSPLCDRSLTPRSIEADIAEMVVICAMRTGRH
jgi:hypothetical protein